MSTAVASLADRLRGAVRAGEPLADYTTYRIGGPAAALVEPADAGDVQTALGVAAERGLPWLVLGLGSNVLVRDAGFPGIVLVMGRQLGSVNQSGPAGTEWTVGAGLPTPLLARRTAREGLSGVHRLVGVPGTVGGGVFMNAGAHGQEFRDVVQRVELITGEGGREERAGGDIDWTYRSSRLGDVVVLGATIRLIPEDPAVLAREIRDHFRWRKRGTPFTQPCCGSVFRNPDLPVAGPDGGELRTAGQLIDAAGLKGRTVGGAEVSTMHANYIVNRDGASADDVLRVIDAVRTRVADRFGVELALEVQVVG